MGALSFTMSDRVRSISVGCAFRANFQPRLGHRSKPPAGVHPFPLGPGHDPQNEQPPQGLPRRGKNTPAVNSPATAKRTPQN